MASHSEGIRIMKKKIIPVLAGIALLAVLIVLFSGNPQDEGWTLERRDIEYRVPATCTVQFPEPYVMTAKAAGDITLVPVVEGQKIKQGDLLVQIDDFKEKQNLAIELSNYENAKLRMVNAREEEYPRLQEQLNNAAAALAEAVNHEARLTRLYRAGGVSRVDWEKADTRKKEAQARYNQIKLQVDAYARSGQAAELIQQLNALDARVKLARRAVTDKRLVAPYNGIVVKLDARRGESLALGESAVTILEDKPWILEAGVDQKELPFLEVGLPCTVTLDPFPAEKIAARVSMICGVIDFAKGTCGLKIEITGNRGFIKHGMTGIVEITGKKRKNVNADVLALPTRFLIRSDEGNFVLVRDGRRNQRTSVSVVPIGEKWVHVTNLPEGTRVVLPE